VTLVLRLVQCWTLAVAGTGGLFAATIAGQLAWTRLAR